ncbi:hypothetical protein RIF29_39420 [Crotalaria pallida]|uniref:Uncharacterized protein n=1 Tax=Crotalaria pallida TaxID=3830 RepID=A0AAN9E214_CROPI
MISAFLESNRIAEEEQSARIHAEFPNWFRKQVYQEELSVGNQQLRHLSAGPINSVKAITGLRGNSQEEAEEVDPDDVLPTTVFVEEVEEDEVENEANDEELEIDQNVSDSD